MKRSLFVLVLTLAMALGSVAAFAAPPAESGSVVRIENADFFFAAVDEAANLVLLGGPPPEQGCLGEGFVPTVDAQGVVLKDGVVVALFKGEQEFFVYAASSIGEVCEGVLGPQEAPELLASGIGHVVGNDNNLFSSESDTKRTNTFGASAHGQLTSPDGERCSMSAHFRGQNRKGEFRALSESVSLNC